MTTEEMIERNIEVLGLSRKEAIDLINDDIKVDKMTTTKQIDSDLTEDQKKNAKIAKQADRKPTVYKLESSRKKKVDEERQGIVRAMVEAIETLGTVCEITNEEREFKFTLGDKIYKVVLSQPRK